MCEFEKGCEVKEERSTINRRLNLACAGPADPTMKQAVDEVMAGITYGVVEGPMVQKRLHDKGPIARQPLVTSAMESLQHQLDGLVKVVDALEDRLANVVDTERRPPQDNCVERPVCPVPLADRIFLQTDRAFILRSRVAALLETLEV